MTGTENRGLAHRMIIRDDCFYYRGSAPCDFHKRDGRTCDACADYRNVGHRTLIVKLDALGDVLRTTSILPAVHQHFENTSVTWLTRRTAAPLLVGNPLVHRVWAVEDNYLAYLLGESFDVAYGLDADALSGAVMRLVQASDKRGFINNAIGRAIPANSAARTWWQMGVNDQLKRENRQTYQRLQYDLCGLAGPIHRPMLPAPLVTETTVGERRSRLKLPPGHPVLGVNTGGGMRWQYKKWTRAGYIELIRRFAAARPHVPILLLGGPEETEFNAAILSAVGDLAHDGGCGNTLSDFCSLVALCRCLVTPDSLGFHVATALNVTALVLVGPTSPWELEVYGNGHVLAAPIDCISCYLARCDKKPACMDLIRAEDVCSHLLRWFS